MELLRAVLSGSARALLAPFTAIHPFWSLIPLSILLGIGLLWCFGRLSNQQAIRDTKRRLHARLYELRLFADEPSLIWKAQIGLLRDNLQYIRLMLVPTAIITVPMLLLLAQLDAFYGFLPLRPGKAAIVTLQLREPMKPEGPNAMLELPDGFVAETPPVRAMEKRQISWRVLPVKRTSGTLRIRIRGNSTDKTISAEPGPRYLSRRHVSSSADLLRFPAEPQIADPAVDWIEVGYPVAEIECLGVRLHWLFWLFIISMATALVFRNRFHVSF